MDSNIYTVQKTVPGFNQLFVAAVGLFEFLVRAILIIALTRWAASSQEQAGDNVEYVGRV
jgi:hypothetical protein